MFDIVEINSEKFKAEYSTLKQTERKNFKTIEELSAEFSANKIKGM